MKTFKFLLPLFVCGLLCGSCDTNDSDTGPGSSDFSQNFGSEVNRSFMGRVVDTNNNPIPQVSIKIGAKSAVTDSNGVFIIMDAGVHEKFAFMTATKTGYIDGSRSMVPTTGINNVKIMLIQSPPVQTIASGISSEVALPSGTTVKFDGEFEDESGNPYSGNISVSLYHLESSNENMGELMPGMLYAETETGEEAVLKTFGMLNVELRGSAGQKLQIATGHTAKIEMLIDDSQLSTAPPSIPLWHFDEVNGYWKEEGSATKIGSKYIGEVAHFSWWNYDAFSSMVNLTLTVTDASGNPLSNIGVHLTTPSGFTSNTQFTNSNGQVSGIVPANQTLTAILDDVTICNLSNSTIGPFSIDTVLSIVASSTNTQTATIQGSIIQCNNLPMDYGYITITNGPEVQFMNITDGTFTFNFLLCSGVEPNFVMNAYNYNGQTSTGDINFTYTFPVTTLGPIVICNPNAEFLTYQVDNDPEITFYAFEVSGLVGVPGFFIHSSLDGQEGFYINSSTSTPGIYNTDTFQITGPAIYLGPSLPNTIAFNLSSYGEVGTFVDLTISGTYTDFTGTHTVSGLAHVLRDY